LFRRDLQRNADAERIARRLGAVDNYDSWNYWNPSYRPVVYTGILAHVPHGLTGFHGPFFPEVDACVVSFPDPSSRTWCDSDLIGISALTHLRVLFIPGSRIGDRTADELSRLQYLEFLDLSGTAITDISMRHLAALPCLRMLKVANTAVTDNGVAYFANSKTIHFMDLHGTRITDNALDYLLTMPELWSACVVDTRVTDGAIRRFDEASRPDGESIFFGITP
jgi:hypothetical protein